MLSAPCCYLHLCHLPLLLQYRTADVFTSRAYGGNPLAVILDARGLDSSEMLRIAREFNYSETTFVLPPDDPANACRIRIFTPGGEVPFAGHPTVGTAIVLAHAGAIPLGGSETRIVIEEGVGPVPVSIRARNGIPYFAQLSVAMLPQVQPLDADSESIARALGLAPSDLLNGRYAPQVVSCGIPFLLVPLRTREAVSRSRVVLHEWEKSLAGTLGSEVMVFALEGEGDADVHSRVFVPGLSVPEDPATGSACAALGGYLAERTPRDDTTLRWTVEQGVEMGRSGRIEVEV
ncbi:MAG TPA: PhzF family phenazine biosynthesis protein, partial [Gemmatimonadales bacterium]|nr:PhzF family phenazine biosynthesis protein [Gemmatimonadales bacterium]